MSFLSINGTTVIQLINFVIFFAVLNVVFLKPVAAAIAKRRAYINSLVSDYDRFQAEAQNLRSEADGIRVAARRDAEQTVAAARAQASNEAAAMSTRYAEQAQRIVEEAQQKAGDELATARSGEDEAVRGLAQLMLERVIPEAVA